MDFSVVTEAEAWKSPVLVLKLRGQLDSLVIQDFEREIQKATEEHPDRAWVFDLSGLDYVSSAGVAIFIGLRYAREKLGGLTFCGMSEKVAAVFATLCLDGVFAIYQDLEEARAKFAS